MAELNKILRNMSAMDTKFGSNMFIFKLERLFFFVYTSMTYETDNYHKSI